MSDSIERWLEFADPRKLGHVRHLDDPYLILSSLDVALFSIGLIRLSITFASSISREESHGN